MPSSQNLNIDLARMSLRNVIRNRRRSLFAGSMIAVAVIGIVFFRGYTLGIKRLLLNAAVKSLVGAFQIQKEGYASASDLAPLNLAFDESRELVDALAAIPNVIGAAPRLRFVGKLGNGEYSSMIVALGVDPQTERRVVPMAPGEDNASFSPIISGEPMTSSDAEEIAVSDEIAVGLQLEVGDTVTLLVKTPNGAMDTVDLAVRAIFRFDDPLGNKQVAILPLKTAQRLLHMPNQITAYAVGVHDLTALDDTVAQARRIVQDRSVPLVALDWKELAPYYRDVVAMQDGVLAIVMLVVIVIVLAGVANTIMMSIFERKREIGTLMAIGFRRPSILSLFVFESLGLAVAAAAAGIALGAAIVLVVSQTGIGFAIPAGSVVMTFPELRAIDMARTFSGALVGSVIAALIPAFRASRLNPIEALKSD